MPEWIDHHPDPVAAFRRESCFTLDYSWERIAHAAGQLDDDNLWWRPYEKANPAGNILLHVAGNLRQWIVSGLGGVPDTRDRASEFARREPIPGNELLGDLYAAVEASKQTIMATTTQELRRPRFVQVAMVTGYGAVYHSVAHFEGHAQEVIYIARLRLGDSYRFKDAY